MLQTWKIRHYVLVRCFIFFSPCQFIPARQRQNDETTLSFLRICAAGCKFCIFPSTRTGSRALKAHLNLEKIVKQTFFCRTKAYQTKDKPDVKQTKNSRFMLRRIFLNNLFKSDIESFYINFLYNMTVKFYKNF